MEYKNYRMYIDESGDHAYALSQEEGKRYLGITGVIFECEYYKNVFHPSFESFKQEHFPHNPDDPVILHRKELVNKSGHFWRLSLPEKESLFNEGLLEILTASQYVVISTVIDKNAHKEQCDSFSSHPYHVCLFALLDGYCEYLEACGAKGDVLAESRGGHEDILLKEAYRQAFANQQVLTSKEIKIKPKIANIAGLQIADLLAHPCKNSILSEKGLTQAVSGKYAGAVQRAIIDKYSSVGNGKIFL